MISARSDDSLQSYTPLINGSEAPSNSWLTSCQRGSVRRRQVLIGVPCIIIVMLACGVLGYFAMNGAFSKVTRDVRIVNGTVIEPNTKISFPVNRAVTMEGQQRVQRLIGVFLKTKHVPEIDASLHVFVEAAYVDRADGRRELAKYKRGAPHAHQDVREFNQFVDVVANGKITVTYEYVMVMTTPGTQMHDHWLANLVELWTNWGATADRVAALKKCFSDWFLLCGFHNHDDIYVEYNSKTRATRAMDNGKPLPPPCADPLYGRAIVSHEFYENGNLVADLLPTLWNTEYDSEFNLRERL